MGTRTARTVCTFPGCQEIGWHDYSNQREYASIPRATWRCTRHKRDGLDVLDGDRRRSSSVLEVVQEGLNRYWRADDGTRNGWAHGPGYQAWASDWPVGTRLVVTATIEASP